MGYSFLPTSILLPKNDIDMTKWSVVACDQYTSNKRYWSSLAKTIGDAPSTLNIIYPEVYLNEAENRTEKINTTMKEYLNTVLEERIQNGYVLVQRETKSGTRLGLVGVIDLENYDYSVGATSPIRATEGTIESRIPVRKAIRKDAPIELPHIMVLVDDPKCQVIEPLFEHAFSYFKLYDFDLSKDGGHITGYAIDGDKALEVQKQLEQLEDESNGFFLAMGDGNHSLATAKACWEDIKANLSESEMENHPARYALVEMVNLHSESLMFEPIHRVLFNVDTNDLMKSFDDYCDDENMMKLAGNEIVYVSDEDDAFEIDNKRNRLPVDVLQTFLDQYVASHPDVVLDYIHGEDEVRALVKENSNCCGFLLGPIAKESLFPAGIAGAVLPRKTFSMGEANEKRYYLECRKLTK